MKPRLLLGALVLAGCADEGPVDCTEEARPGLSVTVRDSVSGTALGQGVRVIAREGAAYADTADASLLGSGVYALAIERAGTYDVSVEHAAYQTWTRAGVKVTADECHVRTVSLLARLQH